MVSMNGRHNELHRNGSKRRRPTPEQVIRKLALGEKLLFKWWSPPCSQTPMLQQYA